jgi:ceramide glucosyltransferase
MTGIALLAWALAIAAVSTMAIVRNPRRAPRDDAAEGRLLLVRPCTGAPRWLAEALRTMPPGWPASGRVLLTVAHANDAARPITRAAAAALRRCGVDARAIVAAAPGCNRKVAQLQAALASHGSDRDVLVVADADVDLASLDLAALRTALGPNVAACFAPPVELEASSVADRASRAVLTASLHAFPLLANLDHDLLVGKAFALRLSALARIGGLAPLAEFLGEDAELARRLRRAGHGIACLPTSVRSFASDRGWPEVFARYVRWALVLRAQRTSHMAAYPLLFAATPLLLTGALAVGIAAPAAAAASAIALASRLAVAMAAARRCGRELRLGAAIVDAALADALLLAAFARAVLVRRVRWGDRDLRLGADGRLQPSAGDAQDESGDRIERAGEPAIER